MKIFLPLSRTLTVFLMTVTLVLVNATAGFAATKTWNAAAGAGLNWTTPANWSGGTIPVAGDDIVFNTAGVLTFSTMPAANIGFNSLTISQGTVSFANGGARVLTIGSGAATDIIIASGAALDIGNNVTITLLDAATTVDIAGALTLSGTGVFTTAANSTVTYSGAAQNIIGASFSNLTLTGTAAKTLLNNTTVSGTLTINAGVTLAMAAFTVGSPSGLVLQSGATASAITGSGLITLGGGVTVNYTGSGATAATIAPPVALGASRTFNIAALASLSMSGVISGAGFGIIKAGDGSMRLSAASTYSGATTISAGVLSAGSNSPSGGAGAFGNAASAIILGDAATAANNSSPTLLIDGAFTIGRAITIANQVTTGIYGIGGNTDNNAGFGGLVTFSQPFSVTQVATTGTNTLAISGGITTAAGFVARVLFDNVGMVTVNTVGITDGVGGPPGTQTRLFKANTGTLRLNVASTYSGDNVQFSGTIILSNPSGLGPPLEQPANIVNRIFIMDGGVMDLATDATVDNYTFYMTGSATILSDRATAGAGITHLLAGLTFDGGALTVNRGLNATSGSPALSFINLRLFQPGTVTTGTADLIITGVENGGAALPQKLTKTGAGTLTKTTMDWALPGDFEINQGTYNANGFNTGIAGNWLNTGGTITGTGTSRVIFNGTSAQTIGGTAPTVFNGLEVNNAAGVSLTTQDETVNAALTLTAGTLTIPFSRTLTIANGTAIAGAGFSAAKSIVTQADVASTAKGFVRINNIVAATVYTIPSSDGTNYLPVTLTPVQATQANNSYSVCVFQGVTGNGEHNGTAFTTAQKNNCVDAVWYVNYNGPGTPTVPGAGTTMTVGWPASLEGVNFAGYLDANIGIAHYGPASWGIPIGPGSNSANTATRAAVTAFSPFGVGNPAFNVLATKITYFNAAKGNGYNTVNWQAACSSSQATFEVLRSTDGRNFTSINSLTASQARCAQPFDFQDNTAPQGIVYYRLKVIDIDGKETLSAIVKLSSEIKAMELTGVSPNPVSNVAQLKINASKADMINLTVISTEGQVMYRNKVQLQPGSSVVNLDIAKLPAGVYMIKGMFSDGETNTVKFMKQ